MTLIIKQIVSDFILTENTGAALLRSFGKAGKVDVVFMRMV